ncbi:MULTISPECIES: hypothetical protein [unclassified Bradyrhizobium]|uniref:hypothetical protein n=1 Tax=unclassified Bradyrhizobium TaxID=2631580 RepID=UPI0003FBAAF5|nr:MULTISPECIES: hypothetical protein [unclassified Bradyrhizobium]MCP3459526.1 hypothetical protein [Bradyrhizobium sp. CCGUVB23]
MSDTETTALLRAVLDEVCTDIPTSETAARERVAATVLEMIRMGCCSADDLRRAGRDALNRAPTMWR